ncbi:hypothetical protein CORC01_00377 [Colletotrichum orchidophilum]|uniref:Uncharacterized protein n=1 Tax=Colletotrichum orchidophilum TaxID=1209926 RepID=A0A1G4BT59_9PEZI|nr:uncharacterized protein CORC01_00377 [Colletotrichum orchidophilum]OHF04525.1 hypothetical protein CORC01_00377 [Colletotrichum orchidophilum]
MASSAIRFVAGTKKSPLGTLYLQCHVKPGASRVREGVTAVTDATVELCVSAQAKEGEANKAVVKLLSGVLGLPKSDLTITQGLKSRDKTVAVSNIENGELYMAKVRERLEEALADK